MRLPSSAATLTLMAMLLGATAVDAGAQGFDPSGVSIARVLRADPLEVAAARRRELRLTAEQLRALEAVRREHRRQLDSLLDEVEAGYGRGPRAAVAPPVVTTGSFPPGTTGPAGAVTVQAQDSARRAMYRLVAQVEGALAGVAQLYAVREARLKGVLAPEQVAVAEPMLRRAEVDLDALRGRR
jgi:hypothetical protein